MNNKTEKFIIQNQKVYQSFNNRWKGFEKHNLLSQLIMRLMDYPINKIAKDLSPETVLDVGCGIGRTMLNFKKLGFKVTGIDNSKASLEFCQKQGFEENKEIFKMDAAKMDFKNRSFDLVFSEGLLEHFKDYEPFVKEMARVSKKYILLIQPNFHSIAGKILNIGTRIIKKENPNELPYTKEDYIESFKKYNCKLILEKRAACGAFLIFLFQK